MVFSLSGYLPFAFTISGYSSSLIPTLIISGSLPRNTPLSTLFLSSKSANSNVNSFSSVLDNLYKFVCATVFPRHCRPPKPKCIKYRARAFNSGLSQPAESNISWSLPQMSVLWW